MRVPHTDALGDLIFRRGRAITMDTSDTADRDLHCLLLWCPHAMARDMSLTVDVTDRFRAVVECGAGGRPA